MLCSFRLLVERTRALISYARRLCFTPTGENYLHKEEKYLLPPELKLLDLGEHRLRDLSRPEQIFQLVAPGLPADFPPLATLTPPRVNLPLPATALIGREIELARV